MTFISHLARQAAADKLRAAAPRAAVVIATCTTRTVHRIAMQHKGKRTAYGYVFPDDSVLTVHAGEIGYVVGQTQPYNAGE